MQERGKQKRDDRGGEGGRDVHRQDPMNRREENPQRAPRQEPDREREHKDPMDEDIRPTRGEFEDEENIDEKERGRRDDPYATD